MTDRIITIGRSSSNTVVIGAEYGKVSARHATISEVDGGVLFVDHSRNGSSVNGHPVHKGRYYLLKSDVVILAGCCRLDLSALPIRFGNDPILQRSSNLKPLHLDTARRALNGTGTAYADAVEQSASSVYYISLEKIVVSYRGKTNTIDGSSSATGFFLSDGRFITARHVVEPWFFLSPQSSDTMISLNLIASHGGTVVSYLRAYNCTGDSFRFASSDMVIYRRKDTSVAVDSGRITEACGRHDWAYIQTTRSGGLPFDQEKSVAMKMLTQLTILGYPLGFGAHVDEGDFQPCYSSAIVAKTGLEKGMILTTSDSSEHGNSGGPVFYTHHDGTLSVIAIVSLGIGNHMGAFVPIKNIYYQQ